MDLSIAYALYFAARTHGVAVGTDGQVGASYESPARVLLSGLGADELFGGYGRHSVAFSRKGYPGLVDELLVDVSRLSTRNLGRDDRVMAHWGKEVRFPYLDECLVKWAMETPAWEKCDFENGEDANGIEAGKRVLRLLALELGMGGAAQEKKRAVCISDHASTIDSPTRATNTGADTIWGENSQDGKRARQGNNSPIVSTGVNILAVMILADTSESRSRQIGGAGCALWFWAS